MKTASQLLDEARQEVPEVTPDEVEKMLKQSRNVAVIDVRDPNEWEQGVVPDAHCISRGMLEFQIERKLPDKNKEIITYCAGGLRSLLAAQALKSMGYQNVSSMVGGFKRWASEGREVKGRTGLLTRLKKLFS